MTIACVIPARFNSYRFPGKLLAKAQGKTVLQRTYEKATLCPELSSLFVATDDERIADHVRQFNGEVIWTSSHCRNGTERIAEALQKDARLQSSSYIINLQGDHPCTEPATLSAIVEALRKDPQAAMSTPATKFTDRSEYLSPTRVKCVFDKNQNALYFSRSPIPYIAEGKPLNAFCHIGIYCYQTSFLKQMISQSPTFLQQSEDLEQLNVLENGFRIKIAVVEETPLGVDTPQDLAKLEKILCQQNIYS